ncbi:MAG TPA: rRNA maturation RNase YbeY [Thermoanaerobaculia bacterium]|nr:rRNA maturation RNase YbeY [Thermoanaerobaculia bacterium]
MRRAATAARTTGGGIEISVTVAGAPPAARVGAWARTLLSKAGAKRPLRASLSILLCGDRRMRGLNKTWRRMDRPTDVLSFPSFQASEARAAARRGEFLGDLVIDVPYAARQARRRRHPLRREVQILLAHGLLHLLGYDHETDGGTMFRLQRRILLSAFGEGPDGVP